MRFKRSFTDPVPANKEKGFADKGIATYRGTARFVADNALEVAGERLEARHVVIASGAEPVPLPIQGAEHVTTAIAFSSSTSYRGGCSLSATPTHRSSSPTSRHGPAPRWSYSIVASGRSRRSNPDLAAKLLERTRALGIDFRARAVVEAIQRTGAGLRITRRSIAAARRLIRTLWCTGRDVRRG